MVFLLREGKAAAISRYLKLPTSTWASLNCTCELPTLIRLCAGNCSVQNSQPLETLFEDDLFESTCEDIANRNEARVIQDIGCLIVPAPEELARRGATHLKHLIEDVDESWIKSIPLVNGPRPQPDFSVRFKSSAFTSDQLKKRSVRRTPRGYMDRQLKSDRPQPFYALLPLLFGLSSTHFVATLNPNRSRFLHIWSIILHMLGIYGKFVGGTNGYTQHG